MARCEQEPRSGAVSSVGVRTGQRKDQQRAKGGREIQGREIQEKCSFFAAILGDSGKCLIRLDSEAGGYEAQPKKSPVSHC